MAGSETVTTQPEGRLQPLDPISRLKLARGILEQTCDATGAGFLTILFLPGTDVILRSFHGLDTPDECVAMMAEIGGMLNRRIADLKAAAAAVTPHAKPKP